MDKIIIGLSILISSNLVISNIFPKTQAVILGVHSNTFVLSIICIITGMMLGIGIRGITESSGKSKSDDDNDW